MSQEPQSESNVSRSASPRSASAVRILDAAEARFAQRGYDATSLNDIADDVGIRTPSLYKHFEGKRALYVAVVGRLLSPYFDLLDRLLVTPRAAEDGEANLLAVLAHYMRTPNLARLVQHATLAEGEELELLVAHWYAPLFRRATELTVASPFTNDSPQQAISVVVAFHAMMSGYMTMAPLHARLMGSSPLAPDVVATQLAVMQRLAADLWNPSVPNDATGVAAGGVSRASRRKQRTKTHA